MLFVRYSTTEDYVEQLLFCCPLAKHTIRKEMLKKVDSFTKEHQLSRSHCVSDCADGAWAITRIKKASYYQKGKQKYLGTYCLLRREKNQTAKKFKIWQFLNKFHQLSITLKPVHYAFVNLVLCVARWGKNTMEICSIWTSVGWWGKVLERVAHTMAPVRY